MRDLCERLPMPQPSWHPFVPEIAACRADFERALAVAAARPDALALLLQPLEDADGAALAPDAPPPLADAWLRLRALPLPSGRHPYLNEILPALDALRLLLVAVSRTGGG